jgi:hypothetical protein
MFRHVRNASLAVLCAATTFAVSLASAPTYRVIFYMTGHQYVAPIGIVEGSPGVFYSNGENLIFSVTLAGKAISLASFEDPPYNSGVGQGVMAANRLLYSSVSETIHGGVGNVFSVGPAAGSEQIYSPHRLSMQPIAGNLPNGELFGIAYDFSNGLSNLARVGLDGNVTLFSQFLSTDRLAVPVYGGDGSYYGVSQPAVSGANGVNPWAETRS